MSSPGQRRGSCSHAMAGFDSHSKCARCRDKGVGDDPCVLKKECDVCKESEETKGDCVLLCSQSRLHSLSQPLLLPRRRNVVSLSDASTARDTRYLASFSTTPQFGIFGAFGRRRDPACIQTGRAPIVSWESFNFIIMKAIFYCEKYTYHFLTIAICWCHPTHWPTLRNVLRNLKRPVSECELACPPSGHVTTLVNNLHYFCWPS